MDMNSLHKLPLLLVLILLSFGWHVHAQSMQEDLVAMFDSANTAYEATDYGRALELYEFLLVDYSHFESEFNAGNAAFKRNDMGRARLHYERARMLRPSHPDLQANLALVESKIIDRITPVPQLGLKLWFASWVGPSRVQTWLTWALFWWSMAWVLWMTRWRKTRIDSKRTLSFLGICAMVFGLLGLWGAQASLSQLETHDMVVVMVDRTDVRSTPSVQGVVLFQLHEGVRADILDRQPEWTEIELANGNVGWIPNDVVEEV